jgi:hypothetical protein
MVAPDLGQVDVHQITESRSRDRGDSYPHRRIGKRGAGRDEYPLVFLGVAAVVGNGVDGHGDPCLK